MVAGSISLVRVGSYHVSKHCWRTSSTGRKGPLLPPRAQQGCQGLQPCMDSDVAQLVRAIHASSTKAAVYVTGGAALVSCCNLLLHCLSIVHHFVGRFEQTSSPQNGCTLHSSGTVCINNTRSAGIHCCPEGRHADWWCACCQHL
jgi:hypothetical protein